MRERERERELAIENGSKCVSVSCSNDMVQQKRSKGHNSSVEMMQ